MIHIMSVSKPVSTLRLTWTKMLHFLTHKLTWTKILLLVTATTSTEWKDAWPTNRCTTKILFKKKVAKSGTRSWV